MARSGWTFSPVRNYTENGQETVHGLVVHIMDGTFEGSKSWFNNPKSEASSHFGTNRDGYGEQWVDTKDRAWAQGAGNRQWVSIENEGNGGDELTDAQITRVAEVLAWLHGVYGVPIQAASGPDGRGLGWHGMGGSAWGGHTSCPGDRVLAQFDEILRRAQEMIGQTPTPTPPPAPALRRELYFRRQNYMTGDDVELLQKRLAHYGAKIAVDGSFGPKTLTHVKNFQQGCGIKMDGIVGPITWSWLWK